MDFDNRKVYGDTFISDGLVFYRVARSLIISFRNRGLFNFLGFSDLDERLLPSKHRDLPSLLKDLDRQDTAAFGFHHRFYPDPRSYNPTATGSPATFTKGGTFRTLNVTFWFRTKS